MRVINYHSFIHTSFTWQHVKRFDPTLIDLFVSKVTEHDMAELNMKTEQDDADNNEEL